MSGTCESKIKTSEDLRMERAENRESFCTEEGRGVRGGGGEKSQATSDKEVDGE